MKKPYVYITRPIPPEVEAYIAEHCEYGKWPEDVPLDYERLKTEIHDADGLLTSGGRIDAEFLKSAPKLKVVSNMSVGYNNMDIAAMKAANVIGTHTPFVLDDTVADLVLGLMLATARRIPELDRYVKEGRWVRGSDTPYFGLDVHHTTLGIIGMGRVGEAIAKRAKYGFDMEVVYYNRHSKPDAEAKLGVQYRPLEQLLRDSDFVVVMMPLNENTRHFIRAEHFAMMKPTAIFINAARGPVIDEQALIAALRSGQIRGAGLDVFDKEPVEPDNPLLTMDNVVTVPHIGSATHRTRYEMAMVAARNLIAAVKGETPPNVIAEFK